MTENILLYGRGLHCLLFAIYNGKIVNSEGPDDITQKIFSSFSKFGRYALMYM